MSAKPGSEPIKPAGNARKISRDKRLKVALKANMAKRKAQVRARDTETGDVSDPDPKKE